MRTTRVTDDTGDRRAVRLKAHPTACFPQAGLTENVFSGRVKSRTSGSIPMRWSVILFVVFMPWSAQAGDLGDEILKCSRKSDSTAQLQCYNKLAASLTPAAASGPLAAFEAFSDLARSDLQPDRGNREFFFKDCWLLDQSFAGEPREEVAFSVGNTGGGESDLSPRYSLLRKIQVLDSRPRPAPDRSRKGQAAPRGCDKPRDAARRGCSLFRNGHKLWLSHP